MLYNIFFCIRLNRFPCILTPSLIMSHRQTFARNEALPINLSFIFNKMNAEKAFLYRSNYSLLMKANQSSLNYPSLFLLISFTTIFMEIKYYLFLFGRAFSYLWQYCYDFFTMHLINFEEFSDCIRFLDLSL